MSASKYKINNPYNPPVHNGVDRPTPSGTQVFDGDNRILTGNTGFSTGPHLHTQAGTDADCQKVINPAPYEFKPGIVTRVGTASQWGKYVIVKVGSKYICYAHLSKNNINRGDEVGMYNGKSAKYWHDWGQRKNEFFLARKKQAIALQEQLDKVKKQLEDLRNRPPETIIKEVERIVEKEVPVPVDEAEVINNWFQRLIKKLTSWGKE